jgi:hypothetical protein
MAARTVPALGYPGFCATNAALSAANVSSDRAMTLSLVPQNSSTFDIPLPARSELAASLALSALVSELDQLLEQAEPTKTTLQLTDNAASTLVTAYRTSVSKYEAEVRGLLKSVKAAGNVTKADVTAVMAIRNDVVERILSTTQLSIGRFKLFEQPTSLLRNQVALDRKAQKLLNDGDFISQRKANNLLNRIERTDVQTSSSEISKTVRLSPKALQVLKKMNYIATGIELLDFGIDLLRVKNNEEAQKLLKKALSEITIDAVGSFVTARVIPMCIVFGPGVLFCATGVFTLGVVLTSEIKDYSKNKIDLVIEQPTNLP